jgi:hypothetical protein
LQVRTGNEVVLGFYERKGYGPDQVVSFGKRLISIASSIVLSRVGWFVYVPQIPGPETFLAAELRR